MAKQELLATIRDRYRASSRKDKSRILDEFIAVTGHHRKHGIRLLGEPVSGEDQGSGIKGRRIYDEAVRGEGGDSGVGSFGPHLWEAFEGGVASPGGVHEVPWPPEPGPRGEGASIDRQRGHTRPAAEAVRAAVSNRRKRRRRLSPGRNISVRTFADWNPPPPGFLEIDLLAHCGESMGGSFVYSLVVTDVCTGWTEAVPLLAREQSLVVAGLEAIAKQPPFPVLGIDSDNDSVFINDTLTEYCADRSIEFTRSGRTGRTTRPGLSKRMGR